MLSKSFRRTVRLAISLSCVLVILGLSFADGVAAAPPIKVTHSGTPVTTAVPGTPFTIKFKVKNTGSSAYAGVRVIFHFPDGLTHSRVAPADAVIQDDTVTWVNVPMEVGQSFYPSFTLTMKAGTALKKKLNLWVEATGTDMEATSTNFSITSVAKKTTSATSTLSSADVSALFQSVYGRVPAASELTYWLGRRTDKPQRSALFGAMAYHQAENIQH